MASPLGQPLSITTVYEYTVLDAVPYKEVAGRNLTVDIYLPNSHIDPANGQPKKLKTPLTTVVFFHGGGWVEGSKASGSLRLLHYLLKGWAVVNVEYRLASEALAPAAVEDARAAVSWVNMQAGHYGFDPNRIIVTGESAGGHLALMAGMQASVSEISIAAIINWAGVCDVKDLLVGDKRQDFASEWVGPNDREKTSAQVSPIYHIESGLPPILSIHGDRDLIVPYQQALQFHQTLEAAGNIHQLYTLHDRGHFDFQVEDWVASFLAVDQFIKEVVR